MDIAQTYHLITYLFITYGHDLVIFIRKIWESYNIKRQKVDRIIVEAR